MRVDQHIAAGGGPARAATAEATVPGRIDVKDRVYRTVTEKASATLIGVPRGDVKVDVVEHSGGIAVRIATPLPVPDLDDSVAIAQSVPVLDRARQLQEQLQESLSGILGRDVTRITLTITGATIPERRRVR
ncbi:hypothetical protein J7E68_07875 [Microbacterium sp. ISL-103]|jgi:hypothetical protein|uniref:hypothetical protein n=1 Tax=Microbacterium sp. ISL-103 TaxID=2819156 RepID=UPI001BE98BA4|nr:hypothetical protein [Microbacterium sp. ISL-103]MBT2474496.1 hypothetical protein [Microbacterium sp. ISL-103]